MITLSSKTGTKGTTLPQWILLADVHSRIEFASCVNVHAAVLDNPAAKAEADLLGLALIRAFEEQCGTIQNRFLCTNIRGGAALVQSKHGTFELHTVLKSKVGELVVLGAECQQLAAYLRTTLPNIGGGDNSRVLNDVVYSAFAHVLSAADSAATSDDNDTERQSALMAVQTHVTKATNRVGGAVQRIARFVYFEGALAGIAAMAVVCTLLGIAGTRFWSAHISPSALVASTLFGALGAVVSVFQRMSTGSLKLDYNAPRSQLLLLGGLRPMVGAIFGAVVQFALGSGLFGTSTTGTSFGVFALLGFVSGFSERFATDMVERAGQVLSLTQKDVLPEEPK